MTLPSPFNRPYSFIADQLAVNIGTELLTIVPGRVRQPAGKQKMTCERLVQCSLFGGVAAARPVQCCRHAPSSGTERHRAFSKQGCLQLLLLVLTAKRAVCCCLPLLQVSTEVDAHLSHDAQVGVLLLLVWQPTCWPASQMSCW
jgi:hypothetical protein